MNAREAAIKRIEELSRREFLTVSDIVTDILHYCEHKGFDFDAALFCAKLYVEMDKRKSV